MPPTFPKVVLQERHPFGAITGEHVTFGSTRAALTLGAALAVSASLLLTPGTAAQAAGTPLAGSPTLKSLGITGQVQDMVVAGGKVWVSWGNEVDVFSTSG